MSSGDGVVGEDYCTMHLFSFFLFDLLAVGCTSATATCEPVGCQSSEADKAPD